MRDIRHETERTITKRCNESIVHRWREGHRPDQEEFREREREREREVVVVMTVQGRLNVMSLYKDGLIISKDKRQWGWWWYQLVLKNYKYKE